MDISYIIANNLKKLRTERNLSLGQLAELCDVSKVMLSQIEKGETNPTINTIWKIVNGLKVPYTAMLEQPESEVAVIQKAETEIQKMNEEHYRIFCYYRSTAERNFELFQLEMDEACIYTSIGHMERSMEYVMVLEGQLTMRVQGDEFTLQKDDTIEFQASGEHTYANTGKGGLKAIILNYYPA